MNEHKEKNLIERIVTVVIAEIALYLLLPRAVASQKNYYSAKVLSFLHFNILFSLSGTMERRNYRKKITETREMQQRYLVISSSLLSPTAN